MRSLGPTVGMRVGGISAQPIEGDRTRAGSLHRVLPAVRSRLPGALRDITTAVLHDRYLQLLILFTIAGLALRLWQLGTASFWLDEALTSYYSRHPFSEIWGLGTDGSNPPTFYWIEHIMLLFGSGEALLRLVPALAGTCTIPVFYLLGRNFHNRTTGLVAAVLLTVSPFHISYSQEARPYTVFLFVFSLALLIYLHARTSGSASTWLLFGVFSGLACWMHLFGFIFVFPLFLLSLLDNESTGRTGTRDLRPVLLAGGTWVLLSLPMLLVMIRAGLRKTGAAELWGLRGIDLITSTLWMEFGRYPAGICILCILFVLGLVRMYQDDKRRALGIAVAIALPLAIAVILSERMAIVPRYLTGLLPFLFLGIGYAVGSVRTRIFPIRFSCIAVLLLIVISIPPLGQYYAADFKDGEDWKGIARDLPALAGPGDVILVHPWFYKIGLNYYYDPRTEQSIVKGADNTTELDRLVAEYADRQVLLILVGKDKRDPGGEIDRWITTHGVLAEQRGDLLVYRLQ